MLSIYSQFTNVRIPRAYMLMKHTQVTRDGTVQEPALAQLTYGALLQGRTAMVTDAANTSKKALVIAIRYAAIRRQFKVGHKEVSHLFQPRPFLYSPLIPVCLVRVPDSRLPHPPETSPPPPCPSRRHGFHLVANDQAL